MKKSFIVVFSTIATLFAGGLVSCNSAATTNTTTTPQTTTVAVPTSTSATTIPVAYLNIDSLVSAYDLYRDLRGTYETKAAKVEKELTSKSRSFENDVLKFQEKVEKGLVTRSQAATMEHGLQKKQQEFVKNRDLLLQGMAEEERVMLNNIQYNIVEYLKEFNADKRYGVILSTTAAGPVLNADPSLNITTIVLDGLNKKYAAENKK